MSRPTQHYHYASNRTILFDKQSRFEKARKIFAVLQEYASQNLSEAIVLDIGCSAGLIASWLAEHVGTVYGIDIDRDIFPAVKEVQQQIENFHFVYAKGDSLCFQDQTFDIVICNIMYYLLPHPAQHAMFAEIARCLKPDGICYFAAPNRLLLVDGKYRLPFLCWLPRWLGRIYVKICSPIKEYHEYYRTLFGLKKLIHTHFVSQDITLEIIDHPRKYYFMQHSPRWFHKIIRLVTRVFYWFLPNYIFILRKRI